MDSQEFDRFCTQFQLRIIAYNVGLRMLRCPTRAEDVAQTVLLQIWRKTYLTNSPDRHDLGAWQRLTGRIARRRCIDSFRKDEAYRNLVNCFGKQLVAQGEPDTGSVGEQASCKVETATPAIASIIADAIEVWETRGTLNPFLLAIRVGEQIIARGDSDANSVEKQTACKMDYTISAIASIIVDAKTKVWKKSGTLPPDLLANCEGVKNAQDMVQLVLDAVEALPDRYFEVILLRYINGYSLNEIGNVLKRSAYTVKSQLARGRQQLYEMLFQKLG